MVKEAEANAGEDKKRREAVDARNIADGMIHNTEKTMTDVGDKLGVAEKAAIETALGDLKAVLDSGDAAAIKDKTAALEALYKAQPEAGAEGAPTGDAGTTSQAEPGVVDAEFSEVKDDKKSGAA
jgi:molecular chaperone DnaK